MNTSNVTALSTDFCECNATCHAEHLVAFSCKRRGFSPSFGARRMEESAALLVDEVLPHEPIPKALRGAGSASVGTQRAIPAPVFVCLPTQNHG